MKQGLLHIPLAVATLAVFGQGVAAQCELDKLTASDAAAGDRFGHSGSLSGNRALVGAPYDDASTTFGSAYVFERQGAAWVETAKLTASDGAAGDFFGVSVSLSGDRALVGATEPEPSLWTTSSGSAYVFEKQGSVWVETAKLTPSDAAEGDNFGISVSLSGDTALVGAYHAHSAYVFEKQGSVWVETAKLNAGAIFFGVSVSLSGDRAAIGAQGSFSTGSVHVFERQGPAWAKIAALKSSDPAVGDSFGYTVSLSGDTVLVGAHYAGAFSGSAYVFEKPAGGWVDMTETAKLVASDAAAFDTFGDSVAVSGAWALVGASGDDDGYPNAGSAYVFEKQGASWVETAKLTASDGSTGVSFGFSGVSLSGDTALVGVVFDHDAGTNSGSAYVFSVSGPCLTGPTPGMVAAVNTATVSNATPGGLVGMGFSLATGSTPVDAVCPGLMLDLDNPMLVGLMTADASGDASFSGFVPASLAGTTVFLQAVDLPACEVSNLVAHTFP